MFSLRQIIISMNDENMKKEIEKDYDIMKYQLFRVSSSEEANWQGKACSCYLMTSLKVH